MMVIQISYENAVNQLFPEHTALIVNEAAQAIIAKYQAIKCAVQQGPQIVFVCDEMFKKGSTISVSTLLVSEMTLRVAQKDNEPKLFTSSFSKSGITSGRLLQFLSESRAKNFNRVVSSEYARVFSKDESLKLREKLDRLALNGFPIEELDKAYTQGCCIYPLKEEVCEESSMRIIVSETVENSKELKKILTDILAES